MNIKQKMASWDGKSAAKIKSIYDIHKADDKFLDTIIDCLFVDNYEKGATWLLKAWLEAGNYIAPQQITHIYSSLEQLKYWEAKLHILQSIPFMPISNAESNKVHSFLRLTLTDQNKFVRAWSYNGFYELSRQHARYKSETNHFFEMAIRDEAQSVKARIRNIIKNGF